MPAQHQQYHHLRTLEAPSPEHCTRCTERTRKLKLKQRSFVFTIMLHSEGTEAQWHPWLPWEHKLTCSLAIKHMQGPKHLHTTRPIRPAPGDPSQAEGQLSCSRFVVGRIHFHCDMKWQRVHSYTELQFWNNWSKNTKGPARMSTVDITMHPTYTCIHIL